MFGLHWPLALLAPCAALLLSARPARAQAEVPGDRLAPGDHEVTLHHGEKVRFFLLHVPPQASAGRPLPLVLHLHGGGGNPTEHRAKLGASFEALADREGFLVAYPAGYARPGAPGRALLTWNAGGCCGPAKDRNSDDVGFLQQVLAEVNARAPVDVTRVYATGFSNGAMMAYRLARQLSRQIAAIAPVAGVSEGVSPQDGDGDGDGLPVPILHVHSVDDPRALYAGGEGPPFPFTNRREQHAPVDQVLRGWAHRNGCAETPRTNPPESGQGDSAGHTVTRVDFAPCASGQPVRLLRLHGPGHVWPGAVGARHAALTGAATRVIDANQEIWAFFRGHRRPQAPPLPAPPPGGKADAPPAPTPAPATGLQLPFARSNLTLQATGVRARLPDEQPASSGALALTAGTTLWGRVQLDRTGARAWGVMGSIEGRALRSDLPAVAEDPRLFRIGAALTGFALTRGRTLLVLQVGGFVAEQGQLLSSFRPRVYGLGLARAPLSEHLALFYGAGYTYDFGRALPLPFFGIDWRLAPAFRLQVLLPTFARLTFQASSAVTLGLATTVAGDQFRYRAAGGAIHRLRIARLRLGPSARYQFSRGVHAGFEGGVEGASVDDGLSTRRARGVYARFSLTLGAAVLPTP